MTIPLNTHNIQRVLEFPFTQPDGVKKIAIGALLAFAHFILPIVPLLFVLGYQKRVARHAIQTGELVMPEWDDWSTLLVDGLRLIGASLLFFLPAILAFVLGFGGMMVSSVGAAIVEEGGTAQQVAWTLPLLIGSLGGIFLFGVGFLLIFALSLVAPIAVAHLIATDDFAAAFRFREWWPILRANVSGFALAYLVLLGVGFAFTLVSQILQLTLVLCCLVPFLFGFFTSYSGIVSHALFGLAYREGKAKLAAPVAAPPAPAADLPPQPAA